MENTLKINFFHIASNIKNKYKYRKKIKQHTAKIYFLITQYSFCILFYKLIYSSLFLTNSSTNINTLIIKCNKEIYLKHYAKKTQIII